MSAGSISEELSLRRSSSASPGVQTVWQPGVLLMQILAGLKRHLQRGTQMPMYPSSALQIS